MQNIVKFTKEELALKKSNYKNNIPGQRPRGKDGLNMFKKFIERIITSENKEDAIQNVFYGENGIDMMYQKEKITYKDFTMLLALIEKMA